MPMDLPRGHGLKSLAAFVLKNWQFCNSALCLPLLMPTILICKVFVQFETGS